MPTPKNQNHHILYLLDYICPREYFVCSNNICINPTMICDGSDDCGDGSDEGTVCSGNILIIFSKHF